MRYYVTSDVHGYFRELKKALTEKVFFDDKEPHKLIVCGDLYDRGTQAREMQDFILDLLSKDEVILVKGNHEDLALDLLYGWTKGSYLRHFYYTNGTIDTVCQLTETAEETLRCDIEKVGRAFLENPYIQTIIPTMVDYYETKHYIFTHGWIPCVYVDYDPSGKDYIFMENWRNADADAWKKARWLNGMEAAHSGVIEVGKTIVCGHWHCSFGHSRYEKDGGEFDNNPNFTPYYGNGIIALDACTPISKKVNCIVIED